MKLQKIILAGCLFIFGIHTFANAKVLLGIDVLQKEGFQILKGKRIGLITNHTGVDSKGKSTIDILHEAQGVQLQCLFAPEHGIRGEEEHGKVVADGVDPKTHLPIYSLYGKTKRPTREMLQGLDALVFDIQDIGTRFYTYTTTLAYALEEAARNHLEFIVLDRPNPITGSIVEGEPLSPAIEHFTAYLKLPLRHGMTVGEIAEWHNAAARLGAKVTVVKMEGWSRGMWWDDTGLSFRPTSPNIRKLNAALLYPGVGAFEATNVSVGRGTVSPFELLGAPWIDSETLSERLNFFLMPGVSLRKIEFTPKDDIYKGENCKGIMITVTDRSVFRPCDFFLNVFFTLQELYPKEFLVRWDEIERVSGVQDFRKKIEMNRTLQELLFMMHEDAQKFEAARAPYLLYENSSSTSEP